jgi:hypothetical protein
LSWGESGFATIGADDTEGRVIWTLLSISKAGQEYFHYEAQRDVVLAHTVVTSIYRERSAIAFEYENGRFRKVLTADQPGFPRTTLCLTGTASPVKVNEHRQSCP